MKIDLKVSKFCQKITKVILTPLSLLAVSILCYLSFSAAFAASSEQFEIIHDQRPADSVYAIMSNRVYGDLHKGDKFEDLPDWAVYNVKTGGNGYYGVVFINKETRQFVMAHKGTGSLAALYEDIKGIVLKGETTEQKFEAYVFTKEMVELANDFGYNLSFTGHSLGAFLAELSVFYCHKDFKYPRASAVTFDSPGGEEVLDKLQPNSKANEIPLKDLDIVGYVSDPNIINTSGVHVGTVYHISPNFDSYPNNSISYTLNSHTIDNFVKYFSELYSDKAIHSKHSNIYARYIISWPASDLDGLIEKIKSDGSSAIKEIVSDITMNPFSWAAAIKSSLYKVLGKLAFYTYFNNPLKQEMAYFKYAKWDDKSKSFRITIEHGGNEEQFDLTYNAHYQSDEDYDPRLTLPLKHFSKEMQKFLLCFNEMTWGIKTNDNDRKRLAEKWAEAKLPSEINTYLLGLRIKETSNGSYIVSLKDVKFEGVAATSVTPIHEFRSKLSEYLNRNPKNIKEMLSAIDSDRAHQIEVAFMKNCTLKTIKDTVYVGVNIPAPTTDDKIKLLKSLTDNNVSFKVTVFENVNLENIEGGYYVGVNFENLDNVFNFKKENPKVGKK